MRVVPIFAHNPGPWTGAGSWTYLLPGRQPTLIDAGSGEARHLQEVGDALGTTAGPETGLAQVLVTHAHPDHAGGAVALSRRWPEADFGKVGWPERDQQYPVDWRPIADEQVLTAGDVSLWAVHTPGHAPDHLCFFEPTSGTLFSGDLVINGSTVVIPVTLGGSMSQYLASLRRVLDLAPRRILPGHGAPIDNPAALLRGYIGHRLMRERQIVDVLAAGADTVASITARVYPSTEPHLLGAASENIVAHLVKLEEEGRARIERSPEGDRWCLVGRGD